MHVTDLALVISAVPLSGDATPVSAIAIIAGIGVGILPIGVARRYKRQHPCQIIPLTDDWAQRHLCLCWRDWSQLSPPMRSSASEQQAFSASSSL